ISRVAAGGTMGWAVSEALEGSIGSVGTWIVLLALIPLGVLCVTQIPYTVVSRIVGARLARRRPSIRDRARPVDGAIAPPEPSPTAFSDEAAPAAPPPLVVKEPARPKSSLVEKGLAGPGALEFGPGGP